MQDNQFTPAPVFVCMTTGIVGPKADRLLANLALTQLRVRPRLPNSAKRRAIRHGRLERRPMPNLGLTVSRGAVVIVIAVMAKMANCIDRIKYRPGFNGLDACCHIGV